MYTIKKQNQKITKDTEQDIVGAFHELAMLYERFQRQILTVAAVVVGALVIIGGYSLYQDSRDKKASAILAQAIDATRAAQPEYEKALDLFRKVRAAYGGTLSADMAQYYAGNCLMNMGRAQEALAEYQDIIKRSSGDKELLGLVYQRMGYAQAALGSAEESQRAFERAETLLGPGVASLELARLYESRGRMDEAKKKYDAAAAVLPGAIPAGASKGKTIGSGGPSRSQGK